MLNSTALTGYERDGFIPAVDVMSAEETLALRQALEAFEKTQGGQLAEYSAVAHFCCFRGWIN